MNKRFTRGQATVEMAVMLLSFVLLILALIFLCGLEVANNQMLLDARYNVITKANSGSDHNISSGGGEIKSWNYSEFNGASIPFMLSDEIQRSSTAAISLTQDTLTQHASDSEAENYKYTYLRSREFNNSLKNSTEFESYNNALAAARLIKGSAENPDTAPLLKNNTTYNIDLSALTKAFQRLAGVTLDTEKIENSISNQVYMPVNENEDL